VALTVELVAADRKVWSGEASRVVARTTDGDIGILPGHAPLLGVLVEGEVRIAGEAEQITAQVDGGFLSVDHDRVTIVAESAHVGANGSN
jgi:F-type H+-transporting ATPase subunit epsilon